MYRFLIDFSQQRLYWVLLLLLGIALEGGALYYQYVLGEPPCVLCIHVRMAVFAFMLVALFAIFCNGSIALVRLLHGINVVAMLWLLERSYQVLAVERGWVFGDCEIALGTPDWFALDKWIPAIFEVKTSCGYTPYLLFEITMAEGLLVISSLTLLASLVLFITSWLE